MASKFPGIAKMVPKPKKGTPRYLFTGKVELLVRMLGEPLEEKRPARYFVNSMADLFYGLSDEEAKKKADDGAGKELKPSNELKRVPDWFIDEVFAVMEKAAWHQFQVLTKRPKRMADYTAKRYASRPPPDNIWLGTTIENQKEHDRRMPHLNRVVTAVRWVSAEPLLSKVTFDLSKVHWVVVGGESGGHGRKMEKAWATDIRDQCKKAKVPFFFKQWGDYNESGLRQRKEKPAPKVPGDKKKQKLPPKLDGAEIQEYPSTGTTGKPIITREYLLSLIGKDRPTLTSWIKKADSNSKAGMGGPLWWSHKNPPPVAGDLFYSVVCPGGFLDVGTTALKKVPKRNIGVSVSEIQQDGKYKVVMAELFRVKELAKVAADL
jgi:protein gp37